MFAAVVVAKAEPLDDGGQPVVMIDVPPVIHAVAVSEEGSAAHVRRPAEESEELSPAAVTPCTAPANTRISQRTAQRHGLQQRGAAGRRALGDWKERSQAFDWALGDGR